MAEKRKYTIGTAVNFLKSKYPNLDYNFLSQILDYDSSVKEISSETKDLRMLLNAMKLPVHQPFKNALSQLLTPKKKAIENLKKNAKLMNDLLKNTEENHSEEEGEGEMESEPEPEIEPKKKKLFPIMSQTSPSFSAPPKKNLAKKRKLSSSEDEDSDSDDFSKFGNVMNKINWRKQVKWWRPTTTKNKQIFMMCYCGLKSVIQMNNFVKRKEFTCEEPNFKKKCGFQLNKMSASKLMSFMQENETKMFPLPICDCKGNSVCQVRGSQPTADEHHLYYFCVKCKSCYLFEDEEKSIKRAIQKRPSSLEEEEEVQDIADQPSDGEQD